MAEFISFAYVKEHAQWASILAYYNLESKPSGDHLQIYCPYHDDQRPSMTIFSDGNNFNCHGCGEQGNVLEFVADMEETDDLRAASRKIAEICGIELAPPREGSRSGRVYGHARPNSVGAEYGVRRTGRRARFRRSGGERPSEEADCAPRVSSAEEDDIEENEPIPAEKLAKLRENSEPWHPYLKKRGIAKAFAGSLELVHFTSGMMKGRIGIPVHNTDSEVVAFAGRWADDDVPEGVDRYRFPKNFHKLAALYNLHRLSATEDVVVVEGFFGAMRLHSWNVPVVSIMGTSMSERQVELLVSAGIKRILLLMDPDDAGRLATERLLPLLAPRFFVRVGELPEGEAPDEVTKKVLLSLAADVGFVEL